ncbi:MAG: alanine dehydrogenase [Flavobacteriales bacterium]|nr:alanine dehydrogenase [Flavobacteriales bacterium]
MSESAYNPFKELAREAELQTQEKLQPLKKMNHGLDIGIPRETTYQENRVSLSPLAVQVLVQNGSSVTMESNAGSGANFTDLDYSDAGARIVYSVEDVYKSNIILKVAPPTETEINLLKPNQILISALQLTNIREEYIQLLMSKKIIAIGYEYIRDNSGALPIIRAMSEIAGRASVLIASEYLANTNFGKGELFGGIPGLQPTEVVILGAGAVGEYAARAALGLGAHVRVFDPSLYKLRRLEANIGQRIYSSTIIPQILAKALSTADVAIGALRIQSGRSPTVVSEAMVENMRPKSLIVDVSIDQGGCFDTSEVTNHKNPTFEKHGVIHYCVPNIPSKFARTASYALSNVFTHLLLEWGEEGSFKELLWAQKGIRRGVYIYKGHLTNFALGKRIGIKAKDIDFLLAGNA